MERARKEPFLPARWRTAARSNQRHRPQGPHRPSPEREGEGEMIDSSLPGALPLPPEHYLCLERGRRGEDVVIVMLV